MKNKYDRGSLGALFRDETRILSSASLTFAAKIEFQYFTLLSLSLF